MANEELLISSPAEGVSSYESSLGIKRIRTKESYFEVPQKTTITAITLAAIFHGIFSRVQSLIAGVFYEARENN